MEIKTGGGKERRRRRKSLLLFSQTAAACRLSSFFLSASLFREKAVRDFDVFTKKWPDERTNLLRGGDGVALEVLLQTDVGGNQTTAEGKN